MNKRLDIDMIKRSLSQGGPCERREGTDLLLKNGREVPELVDLLKGCIINSMGSSTAVQALEVISGGRVTLIGSDAYLAKNGTQVTIHFFKVGDEIEKWRTGDENHVTTGLIKN